MLIFKEIQLLPEIFLGISIIYLIIHGTLISVNTKYLLIQNSVLYLSVLIISMFCFLLLNNAIECSDFQIFNNGIIVDFLSFSSKIWIAAMSIFCFLMIQRYLAVQKINYFEYSLLILFAFTFSWFLFLWFFSYQFLESSNKARVSNKAQLSKKSARPLLSPMKVTLCTLLL